jgi:isoaspartyl peptidase/L-asparaginase-like protein (Ntn-hydrolase superfamily)
MNRRDFLTETTLAATGTALAIGSKLYSAEPAAPPILPAAIATWEFGRKATTVAGKILSNGGNSLDAVEKGINVVELDTSVNSVGYGGLPNEEGAVQLDAVIMYGPTHAAGAVASLEGIATPISVARKLMEKGKPTLLVGPGAQEYALKSGFQKQDLLTPESKKRWDAWKQRRQRPDPSEAHDTVGVVAIDKEGRITAGCSTSGLPWKMAGRVGDSPIIGAGAFCDNDIGGAAATGNGDLMMRFCLSFHVVELMRQGQSPKQACETALQRMIQKGARTDAAIVALNKKGEFGAARIGIKFQYAVWTKDVDEVVTIEAQRG